MSGIRLEGDIRQVFLFSRAASATATETKPTTVTELKGMSTAANKGVRFPLTAKATPTTL